MFCERLSPDKAIFLLCPSSTAGAPAGFMLGLFYPSVDCSPAAPELQGLAIKPPLKKEVVQGSISTWPFFFFWWLFLRALSEAEL